LISFPCVLTFSISTSISISTSTSISIHVKVNTFRMSTFGKIWGSSQSRGFKIGAWIVAFTAFGAWQLAESNKGITNNIISKKGKNSDIKTTSK
jgi:hypothetical protein